LGKGTGWGSIRRFRSALRSRRIGTEDSRKSKPFEQFNPFEANRKRITRPDQVCLAGLSPGFFGWTRSLSALGIVRLRLAGVDLTVMWGRPKSVEQK
jgi:hypothetical protein